MPIVGDVFSYTGGSAPGPAGTTISSTKRLTRDGDVESALNTAQSIPRGGTGAVSAVAAADNISTTSINIASATTTDLSTATGVNATITGTTTITGFGTVQSGAVRYLTFSGILILTHNATSLILPGGANLTTAVGDSVRLVSLGSGNWKCTDFTSGVYSAADAAKLAGIEALAEVNDPWKSKPIGEPFPILDHITGVDTPPTDQSYRYVLLTHGEAGLGEYNEGVVDNESTSGSSPNIVASFDIDLATSPLDNETIRCINTEGRFLRPGATSGTLQDSQNLSHQHEYLGTNTLSNKGTSTSNGLSQSSRSTALDGGDEARPRSIAASYYMRIL